MTQLKKSSELPKKLGTRSLPRSAAVPAAAHARPTSKADSGKLPPLGTPRQGLQQPPQQAPVAAAAVDDYVMPIREVVRPANQLPLSAAELEEEIGRELTTGDPGAPASLVRYHVRERGYRAEPILDQQLEHLLLGGCLMHLDSEAAAQEQQRQAAGAPPGPPAAKQGQAGKEARPGQAVLTDQGAGAAGPVEACVGPDASPREPEEEAPAKRLRNFFNFAARAAQTAHQPPRDRGTMTEPPPTASASGSCSRAEIYAAYTRDQEQRQRQADALARQEAPGQPAAAAHKAAQLARKNSVQGAAAAGGGLAGRAVKLVERMVQQNLMEGQIQDFRYWDDPSDAIRPEEGTLLPLWGDKDGGAFSSPRVKRRAVTALAWCPRYADLFAAGYGSYDCQAPTTGLVVVYSLKSPCRPELVAATAAGVMCLDFHPEHPALLAVGCHDGAILVFDLRSGRGEPAFQSSARSGKHSEPVWQLSWQRGAGHEVRLCTISTDGRVTQWTFAGSEMQHQDVLLLGSLRPRTRLPPPPPPASPGGAKRPAEGVQQALQPPPPQQLQLWPGQQQLGGGRSGTHSEDDEGDEHAVGIAGGCCFDFHPQQQGLFVVGSEDGGLYQCSTALATQFLQAHRPGHRLPVYAVRWNPLHPRAFLSAGADWKLKLWDADLERPVSTFDLRSPVGDVAWAPSSSTVFAAATDAGKVAVFDLALCRDAPVCVQRVARKARLTRLAFNPRHPVLLAGTEHGAVLCLKLSPNLRRTFNPDVAAPSDQAPKAQAARAAEAARLDAVLQLAGKCNAALQEEDWELM